MIFIDGGIVESSYPTPQGIVDVVADVKIHDRTLELLDLAVFSGNGTRIRPGVRLMLAIAREAESFAKLQGFTRLVVSGKRLSGATPGRAVLVVRRIR